LAGPPRRVAERFLEANMAGGLMDYLASAKCGTFQPKLIYSVHGYFLTFFFRDDDA
jgi:hypothetical protein